MRKLLYVLFKFVQCADELNEVNKPGALLFIHKNGIIVINLTGDVNSTISRRGYQRCMRSVKDVRNVRNVRNVWCGHWGGYLEQKVTPARQRAKMK